jgi:hypothetical protein
LYVLTFWKTIWMFVVTFDVNSSLTRRVTTLPPTTQEFFKSDRLPRPIHFVFTIDWKLQLKVSIVVRVLDIIVANLQIEITNSFLQETIILLVYFRGYLNFGKTNIRHRYANTVITKLLQEIIFKQRQQLPTIRYSFRGFAKKELLQNLHTLKL